MEKKIKSVTIKGLWGVKTIKTNFLEDINIFIGSNGTSKTTFLSLIESVLQVDMNVLNIIYFDRIIIEIENDIFQITTINVEKKENEIPLVIYNIDGNKFEIPCIDIARRGYNRFPFSVREEYLRLKKILESLINISWISVHRESISQDEIDRGRERNKNTVDERLDELMRKLTVYQLQLESEASKISDKFKEDVFTLMLYNPQFDKVDAERFNQFDTKLIKKDLYTTYKELGVSIKDKSDIINNHIVNLSVAIEKIKTKQTLVINDVFPLSLVNRTLSLIEISKNSESNKQDIFKPINLYLDSLKKFMPDKDFKLDKDSSGQLEIKLKNKFQDSIPLQLFSLSSGEKQLVILLTETLLQKQESYLFIADEPELSLHISWQRQIIESLRDLNPNAQIVVATHSPEIAGKWSNKIINMENITSYEHNNF